MKDYPQGQKMNLTIPTDIWNDKKVNGMQKMQLALIKTLTQNGQRDIDYMTKMQAKIMCTHEKDVIYNMAQLAKKGFIEIYDDVLSETGQKIKYKYNVVVLKAAHTQPNDTSSLF